MCVLVCVCVCVCVCAMETFSLTSHSVQLALVEYQSILTDMAETLFTRNLMVIMVGNTYRAYTHSDLHPDYSCSGEHRNNHILYTHTHTHQVHTMRLQQMNTHNVHQNCTGNGSQRVTGGSDTLINDYIIQCKHHYCRSHAG